MLLQKYRRSDLKAVSVEVSSFATGFVTSGLEQAEEERKVRAERRRQLRDLTRLLIGDKEFEAWLLAPQEDELLQGQTIGEALEDGTSFAKVMAALRPAVRMAEQGRQKDPVLRLNFDEAMIQLNIKRERRRSEWLKATIAAHGLKTAEPFGEWVNRLDWQRMSGQTYRQVLMAASDGQFLYLLDLVDQIAEKLKAGHVVADAMGLQIDDPNQVFLQHWICCDEIVRDMVRNDLIDAGGDLVRRRLEFVDTEYLPDTIREQGLSPEKTWREMLKAQGRSAAHMYQEARKSAA